MGRGQREPLSLVVHNKVAFRRYRTGIRCQVQLLVFLAGVQYCVAEPRGPTICGIWWWRRSLSWRDTAGSYSWGWGWRRRSDCRRQPKHWHIPSCMASVSVICKLSQGNRKMSSLCKNQAHVHSRSQEDYSGATWRWGPWLTSRIFLLYNFSLHSQLQKNLGSYLCKSRWQGMQLQSSNWPWTPLKVRTIRIPGTQLDQGEIL